MAKISRKKKWGIFGLAFLTFSVVAATVSINAGAYPYTQVPSADGVDAFSLGEVRIAGLFGLAGMYRTTHGPSSLPGSKIKVTWSDGSSEEAAVTCLAASVCIVPVPGTQKKKPSVGGGGSGSGSGSPGGSSGGSNPGSGCYGNCSGSVDVGPPTMAN